MIASIVMKKLSKYSKYLYLIATGTTLVGLLLWQLYFQPDLDAPSEAEINNAEAIKSWMDGERAKKSALQKTNQSSPQPFLPGSE